MQPALRVLGRAPPKTLFPVIDGVSGIIRPGERTARRRAAAALSKQGTSSGGAHTAPPLHAWAGVFTVLLGPPGSGKTTFLRTLAGLGKHHTSLKASWWRTPGWPADGIAYYLAYHLYC